MRLYFGAILIISLTFLGSMEMENDRLISLNKESTINDVLKSLGDNSLDAHKPDLNIVGVSALKGEELVKRGFTKNPSGMNTRKISRHFVCTSCHNVAREDQILNDPNPEARLEYVAERGMPFLQGTSFFGIVNRTSFYNGSYKEKYGDLVNKARNDLRQAIQLCSTECSQGRKLKKWELESILAYFWTLELKISDLDISDAEILEIFDASQQGRDRSKGLSILKSRYMQSSPATFVAPPKDRQAGNQLKGNSEIGKQIYENGCLHCHRNQRYSFFNLDNQQITFKHLYNHFPLYTHYSIYQVGRYGTSPKNGKRAYMPQYTVEKMSRQQMEDLRAFIATEAQK
jgi:mono/diheme cytochrome c family protein